MPQHEKRVSDRMLPKALADRADRVRSRGVRGDYLRPDGTHVCRFCGTPIRVVEDGRSMVLGNFTMWELTLDSGTIMSVNSCKECFLSFDASDEDACEAVFASNAEAWAREHERAGRSKEEHVRAFAPIYVDRVRSGAKKRLFRTGMGRN